MVFRVNGEGNVWEDEGGYSPDGKNVIGFETYYYTDSIDDESDRIESGVREFLDKKYPSDNEFKIEYDYSTTDGREYEIGVGDDYDGELEVQVSITVSDKVDLKAFAAVLKEYILNR